MPRDRPGGPLSLGDLAALRIQELRGRGRGGGAQPLLKVDNRRKAARMPYQFDSSTGRLHRRGCRAIPATSRSALYGLERMTPDDQGLACPVCRPTPGERARTDGALSSDLVYGLISILDQFGGTLRERGREYRRSRYGRQLRTDLAGLYASLGEREQDVLGVVAAALDGLVKAIHGLEQDFDGNGNHDGAGRNGRGRPR